MSLNEIYDGDQGHKSWQNYRINNLDIAQYFNIDTTGASVGDILELDGSLNYTWQPYSSTIVQPLDHSKVLFGTSSVTEEGNIINVTSITGSPIFSISSGKVQVSQDVSLLLFLNITSVPSQYTLPLFQLVAYKNGAAITLCQMSPYVATGSEPYASANCIAPVQLSAGDTIAVFGYLVGNSSQPCSIVTAESNLNILRLN